MVAKRFPWVFFQECNPLSFAVKNLKIAYQWETFLRNYLKYLMVSPDMITHLDKFWYLYRDSIKNT